MPAIEQTIADVNVPLIQLDVPGMRALPLKAQLDLRTAYRSPKGTWLARFPLGEDRPEPIVLLFHRKQKRARGSIIQRDEGGEVVGGFTLHASGA